MSRAELEIQESNALSLAKFFRDQINKLNRPEKIPDKKLIAAKAKLQRSRNKRYS